MAKSATRAEILIYGDIGSTFWGDGVTAADFVKLLDEVGPVNDLDIRITSYGGDVYDGMTIYRRLVDHKATVTMHIDGIAASIASVIAMAGDKIVINEAGRMMIHDALTIAVGNAEDMRRTADVLDQTSEQIAEVYSARSGKGPTEVRDKMRAETWFTGKEAVAFGLATEVAPNKTKEGAQENSAEIVALDTSKHKFRNAPVDLLPGRAAIAAQVARQQVAITLSRASASAKR
jgi:ATP-dependent Clp protease protease subunit